MNDILMEVNNPREYITALSLARNAFLRCVSIGVNNIEKTFSASIEKDIQEGIRGIFSSSSGFFPAAQTRSYSSKIIYNPFGNGANVRLNAVYMSSEKERNDFICVAAEISELLIQKCGYDASDYAKVIEFSNWVREHFIYKNNEVYQDHSAAGLLKNRSGVCQAIAALSCVVLPYMGMKVQYVIGEGKGVGGWGCHAWNMVYIDNKWIHMDFTFAMNSLVIPMTEGLINKKLFMSTHRWDKKIYSDSATEAKYKMNSALSDAEVILYLNKGYMEIDGVKIFSRIPIYYKKNNVKWIRYYDLVKFLGGGCEYIPDRNELIICVSNKRYSIKNAFQVLDADLCGIRSESLDALNVRYVETNKNLMFKF